MTAFSWKENYSVHNEPMDSQHRRIFDYMSAIHQAMENNLDEDELDERLDRFDIYCKMHFFEEERLMEEIGFPSLIEHKKQHDQFLLDLDRFRASRGQKPSGEASAAFTVIKDRFVGHILNLDLLYSKFLEKKAASGDGKGN